jgi:hypothetical protein
MEEEGRTRIEFNGSHNMTEPGNQNHIIKKQRKRTFKMKKWTRSQRIFFIILMVGIAANVIGALILQPWGSDLGVPGSPQRQVLVLVMWAWLLMIPLGLFMISIVAAKPEWVAPRGRYVEGKPVKIFTPYTYTAIAFTAALFAVAGIGAYQVADLPAAAAALGISYFNPIIGFFATWIGGVLRAMIFGQGDPVQWAIASGPGDGAVWIVLGVAYWWFREKSRWGKNPILLILWWIAVYWVWRSIAFFLPNLWLITGNMYLPQYGSFLTAQLPTGTIASVAMLSVVEVIIRAIERRSETSKDAPAA